MGLFPKGQPFDFWKMIQMLTIVIIIFYLLYSFLDIGAISSGEYERLLRSDVNVNATSLAFFGMVLLYLVIVMLNLVLTKAAGQDFRMDAKFFLSLILYTVIIWGAYSYVAQPIICGLFSTGPTCPFPSLKVMAMQIYSISPGPIQGAVQSIAIVVP